MPQPNRPKVATSCTVQFNDIQLSMILGNTIPTKLNFPNAEEGTKA
jgi:hypothetical protein